MATYTVVTFFDPPQILDPTVTPIPAATEAPLQVIADTGIVTGVALYFSDTTGDFIGVYIGAPGQETLVCTIGNGLTAQSWGRIPPHSRVSLRAMKNQRITGGSLTAAVVTV